MRKLVGELFQDEYAPLAIITETAARTDFNAARDDAVILLTIHDQATGGKAGRPKRELAALKRSALILAVTAWESFVEDTVTEHLKTLLAKNKAPETMSSVFNAIAHEWSDPNRSGTRKPPEYRQWTGDGWKTIITHSLQKYLESFHTPNTENVRTLFTRYLSVDPTKQWSWQAVGPAKAQKQLDALIKVRGGVVHRGRTIHPSSMPVKDVDRGTVVKALNLVYNLVYSTEVSLGVAPTEQVV
jgi:hypothetical protein